MVTIGTDGVTHYVKTPDGLSFNMGAVSPMKFVMALVGKGNQSLRLLRSFEDTGEAMFPVDLTKMWTLLSPPRTRWRRWAADGPFMPADQRRPPSHPESRTLMTEQVFKVFSEHLARIEADLKALEAKASSDQLRGAVDKTAALKAEYEKVIASIGEFVKAAQNPAPASSDTPSDKAAVSSTPGMEGLHYDTYQQNSEVATRILDQAEETAGRIDKLVEAGKKFNATQAKGDVHAVTVKVAGILRDVDITKPWVQEDLGKLASRMGQLHGLFFPKA